jgi:hypothetical protein
VGDPVKALVSDEGVCGEWNPVTEDEFWRRLEYRVSHELAGLEGALRFLWCDGFVPDEYLLDGDATDDPRASVGRRSTGALGVRPPPRSRFDGPGVRRLGEPDPS